MAGFPGLVITNYRTASGTHKSEYVYDILPFGVYTGGKTIPPYHTNEANTFWGPILSIYGSAYFYLAARLKTGRLMFNLPNQKVLGGYDSYLQNLHFHLDLRNGQSPPEFGYEIAPRTSSGSIVRAFEIMGTGTNGASDASSVLYDEITLALNSPAYWLPKEYSDSAVNVNDLKRIASVADEERLSNAFSRDPLRKVRVSSTDLDDNVSYTKEQYLIDYFIDDPGIGLLAAGLSLPILGLAAWLIFKNDKKK